MPGHDAPSTVEGRGGASALVVQGRVKGDLDFAAVNAAAQACAGSLCREMFPGGRVVGNEFVAGDIHGGPGDSFKVNLTTGKHADFAADVSGGDFVALWANRYGMTQGDAARELACRFGISFDGPPRRKPAAADALSLVAPVPAKAPEPPKAHHAYGRASATWDYQDAEGRTLFHVCRFDPPGGKKQVLPVTLYRDRQGALVWRFRGYPEPRPLYGLDRLAKAPEDNPVVVVEGEKAADAMARLVPKAVAMVGCQSESKIDPQTESNSDPLRQLILWPHLTQPSPLSRSWEPAPLAIAYGPTQREEGRAVKAERSLRSEPKGSLDGLAAHATFGHGGENSLARY